MSADVSYQGKGCREEKDKKNKGKSLRRHRYFATVEFEKYKKDGKATPEVGP